MLFSHISMQSMRISVRRCVTSSWRWTWLHWWSMVQLRATTYQSTRGATCPTPPCHTLDFQPTIISTGYSRNRAS